MTMATGRWLLLLPLLMDIVMARFETNPPGKHQNTAL